MNAKIQPVLLNFSIEVYCYDKKPQIVLRKVIRNPVKIGFFLKSALENPHLPAIIQFNDKFLAIQKIKQLEAETGMKLI